MPRSTVDPRYSKWRVWKKLDHRAQVICETHGQDANDLVQLALEEYISRITRAWHSLETYAVVMEIRSNQDWEEVACLADDYTEFCGLMNQRGMMYTRANVYIRDKRISRMRITDEIRKRNKVDVEKKDAKG